MSKSYQYILFDLDGTLTDPYEGITRSMQYAAKHFGVEVTDRRTLSGLIGPSLFDSFRNYFEFDEETTQKAVAKYREYYSVTGIYENTLYPGISELLSSLKEAGKTLILATSKPTVFAARILQHFELDGYFTFISGSELDGSRVEKSDVIAYALKQVGVTELTAVLMVGDRRMDVEGAHEIGIDCAGVLYGYGSREELTKAGADFLVESPEELQGLLL